MGVVAVTLATAAAAKVEEALRYGASGAVTVAVNTTELATACFGPGSVGVTTGEALASKSGSGKEGSSSGSGDGEELHFGGWGGRRFELKN
ncbi:hypothetical protein BDV29DRAFT_180733 [Aspergillus leporis]|uniref:Uncharacterized protein n=1 Tax=Aspergillus leporis TaxID=41062 RepID=A0A5N5WPQ8_9EURO|nr:hypothetical protein BDV29DRAFT_180733 [Aspergillus leporis]